MTNTFPPAIRELTEVGTWACSNQPEPGSPGGYVPAGPTLGKGCVCICVCVYTRPCFLEIPLVSLYFSSFSNF